VPDQWVWYVFCVIVSYRIEKEELLAIGLARIAAEEIDLAISELDRRDHGEAIHNARKALKRLRALLRAIRVAFPEKFRAENRYIAEIGRKISPLRDIHVQLHALNCLGAVGSAGQRTRETLLRRQSDFCRKIPEIRETVKKMLRHSSQSIAKWPLEKVTPDDLAASITRIYKKGREAFKTARKNNSPENLHEWRKQAKWLGYTFELIEVYLPHKTSKMIKRVEALSAILGDDHDLFMVQTALDADKTSRKATGYRSLTKKICARRRKLQKKAFKAGPIIYAQKPVRLKKQLKHCLAELGKPTVGK
jgi:CHAD domain-containing protein